MFVFFRLSLLMLLGMSLAHAASPDDAINTKQDVRIFTTQNKQNTITPQSIQKTFEEAGFIVDKNKDMNEKFKKAFGKTHYHSYRLFTVHSTKHLIPLLKKSDNIGLITPLSMSIYTDPINEPLSHISIASLSLRGMARATNLTLNDPDLIAYNTLVQNTIEKAFPGGKYKTLKHKSVELIEHDLAIIHELKLKGGKNKAVSLKAKQAFQDEFKTDLAKHSFTFPGQIDLAKELTALGENDFDYFDTISICKIDVIYPIHQTNPEFGAYAPCTLFMFKRRWERFTKLGYPSVENWTTALDVKEEKVLQPLIDAHQLFEHTIEEIIE